MADHTAISGFVLFWYPVFTFELFAGMRWSALEDAYAKETQCL